MGKVIDFIKACAKGEVNTVKKYMQEKGFHVHGIAKYENKQTGQKEDLTGLFAAVQYNQLEVLKLLYVAKQTFFDGLNYQSPLYMAAMYDSINVVEFLCNETTSDVNQGLSPKNAAEISKKNKFYEKYAETTPLYIAISAGHNKTVEVLLRQPTINVNQGLEKRLIAHGDITYSESPLYRAAALGHTQIVQMLLEHPSINIQLGSGDETPLQIAEKNGHSAISKLLINIISPPHQMKHYHKKWEDTVLISSSDQAPLPAPAHAKEKDAANSQDKLSIKKKPLNFIFIQYEQPSTISRETKDLLKETLKRRQDFTHKRPRKRLVPADDPAIAADAADSLAAHSPFTAQQLQQSVPAKGSDDLHPIAIATPNGANEQMPQIGIPSPLPNPMPPKYAFAC